MTESVDFARAADEAPPLVPVELARHVRSQKGAAFYHKSIGTLLTGDDAEKQYADQKAKNDSEKEAKRKLRALRAVKRVTSGGHSDLLAARRAARAKFPTGHPERLAAERAVRASRKSTTFKDARHNATQAQSPKAKKSTSTTNNRDHLIVGGAPTSAVTKATGGSFSPHTPQVGGGDNVAVRLKELNLMSEGERSQYFALRNAGLHHDAAMKKVHERRNRPQAPKQVVTKVKARRSRRSS